MLTQIFGSVSLSYYEGIYYSGGSGRYRVVQPEVGMIVNALPVDYEKVVVDGIIYYEYNNVLYTKVSTINGKGYQVVGFID